MRAMVENKARTRADRCHMCGRPVGDQVEQCRPKPGGWFCWAGGYQVDLSQVVPYVPAPIGEREQAVIDEYGPRVAELEAKVDELLAAYTVVDQSYASALFAGAEIGVGELITPTYGARRASPRDRKRAADLINMTGEARTAAGERLQRARVKLNALYTQVDHRRRVARQPVREEEF